AIVIHRVLVWLNAEPVAIRVELIEAHGGIFW
ncbi:MAG: hypothetical protein ACI9G1_003908, partial [Pirellulaceae bacterium]